MLVLSRRIGEHLVIARDIVVTVLAIEGNKVRIGVDAPKSIRVDREEVHNRRNTEENHESLGGERRCARLGWMITSMIEEPQWHRSTSSLVSVSASIKLWMNV